MYIICNEGDYVLLFQYHYRIAQRVFVTLDQEHIKKQNSSMTKQSKCNSPFQPNSSDNERK